MVEGDPASTTSLIAAALGLFGVICAQGIALFLYLNTRINGMFGHIDEKFDAMKDETSAARREANEVLVREIASQRVDLEDLKRNAARHEDLRQLETRFMTVVGDLRDGVKEIGRKVETGSIETIKTLARIEARLGNADKEPPRP